MEPQQPAAAPLAEGCSSTSQAPPLGCGLVPSLGRSARTERAEPLFVAECFVPRSVALRPAGRSLPAAEGLFRIESMPLGIGGPQPGGGGGPLLLIVAGDLRRLPPEYNSEFVASYRSRSGPQLRPAKARSSRPAGPFRAIPSQAAARSSCMQRANLNYEFRILNLCPNVRNSLGRQSCRGILLQIRRRRRRAARSRPRAEGCILALLESKPTARLRAASGSGQTTKNRTNRPPGESV